MEKRLFVLYVLVIIYCACGEKPIEVKKDFNTLLQNSWLGVYIGASRQLPNPVIYQYKSDSLIIIDHLFNKTSHYLSLSDTIIKDTFNQETQYLKLINHYNKEKKLIQSKDTFLVNSITEDFLKTFNFNNRKGEKLVRIKDFKLDISVKEVKNWLNSGIWTSNKKKTANNGELLENDLIIKNECVFEDEFIYLKNSYYIKDRFIFDEYEKFCYQIGKHQNQLFISEMNTFKDCKNPLNIYQISAANEAEITFINQRNKYQKEFKLTKKDKIKTVFEVDENAYFQPCTNQEDILFFYNNSTYKGGKKALKRFFKSKYKTGNNRQTGYIKIGFFLNCEGELGRYQVQQMDENFQPFAFDSTVVYQLLKILKQSKNWVLGKKLEYLNMEEHDISFFLMFKIEYGKLIDIYP